MGTIRAFGMLGWLAARAGGVVVGGVVIEDVECTRSKVCVEFPCEVAFLVWSSMRTRCDVELNSGHPDMSFGYIKLNSEYAEPLSGYSVLGIQNEVPTTLKTIIYV